MSVRSKRRPFFLITAYFLASLLLCGCARTQSGTDPTGSGQKEPGQTGVQEPFPPSTEIGQEPVSTSPGVLDDPAVNVPLRDNTPVCLVPAADGQEEIRNDVAVIDYSHADEGYFCANYTGTVSKVKLMLFGPDEVKYTYDLHGNGYEVFPLSSGDGTYQIGIYENISGTSYSTCLYTEIDVTVTNEFGPFLYPNQYVNFNAESKTVAKGAELSANCDTDLDVIINVYNYIISSITYDYDKAKAPPAGYTSDVDETLSSGMGICLDYAAVMASMLRSQRIPTRLEVGYAQDAYHAWISIYTDETGWLNGLIEFSGDDWTLVDPTFGANTSEKALKKFIGDGSNYILQKVY